MHQRSASAERLLAPHAMVPQTTSHVVAKSDASHQAKRLCWPMMEDEYQAQKRNRLLAAARQATSLSALLRCINTHTHEHPAKGSVSVVALVYVHD